MRAFQGYRLAQPDMVPDLTGLTKAVSCHVEALDREIFAERASLDTQINALEREIELRELINALARESELEAKINALARESELEAKINALELELEAAKS